MPRGSSDETRNKASADFCYPLRHQKPPVRSGVVSKKQNAVTAAFRSPEISDPAYPDQKYAIRSSAALNDKYTKRQSAVTINASQ